MKCVIFQGNHQKLKPIKIRIRFQREKNHLLHDHISYVFMYIYIFTYTQKLGGGFGYVLFAPLLGEDFQFDEHIFQIQMGYKL